MGGGKVDPTNGVKPIGEWAPSGGGHDATRDIRGAGGVATVAADLRKVASGFPLLIGFHRATLGLVHPRRCWYFPLAPRRATPSVRKASAFVGRTMPEPWVSVDMVASHLGVAKDSVYRWIEAKGLPAHRVGRLWKFRLSEIDEWVHVGGAKGDDEPKESR